MNLQMRCVILKSAFILLLLFETVLLVKANDCSDEENIKMLYSKKMYTEALHLMLQDTVCIEESYNNWLMFLMNEKDTLHFKKLLEMGYPTHYDNGHMSGETVLHTACFFERTWFARILLEHGADINQPDTGNETPFLLASRHGYNFCEPFFSFNPDVNIMSDIFGDTPLFKACRFNKDKLARALVDRGAEINVKNSDGHTPLMAAVSNRNLPLVSYLLDAGADIHATDFVGINILFYAATAEDLEIFDYLVQKGANVHHVSNGGATVLMSAVYSGNTDLVGYVLDLKPDITERDNYGFSAYTYTVYNKTSGIAEMLKQYGADIFVKDYHRKNALDYAIKNDNQVMIEYYKKEGLTTTGVFSGLSQLEVEDIIENNEIDKINKFTKGQADTVYDGYDVAPIHMAADLSNLTAMKALVAKGARPNPINSYGLTPLMFCIRNGNMECIDYLLGLGINADTTLQYYHLRSAIYEAIKSRNKDIVLKLLLYGVNVNKTDYDFVSPLDYAACKSTKEIVKLIFDYTDKSLLKDKNKLSPHEYAQIYCENEENAAYVKMLIREKYGKDITQVK